MGKRISVFIDSGAWDVLFECGVDLAQELPPDGFEIKMTKEVSSFEVASIPDHKAGLKNYIQDQMKRTGGTEDCYFGFASYDDPLGLKSRVGGVGRFIGYQEAEIHKELDAHKTPKEMGSGLFKNEGDISLAVRALTGNVVLTAERKGIKGPLKEAFLRGGKVISLVDFPKSGLSLNKFIVTHLGQLP